MIRIATEQDIYDVADLWLQMVSEMQPTAKPNVEWWIEQTRLLMTSESYFMFVYEDSGKIVGFSDILVVSEPSTGEFCGIGRHIYVMPEYRDITKAGLLYRKVIQTAKKVGASAIDIPCNPSELGKWLSCGYRVSNLVVRKI